MLRFGKIVLFSLVCAATLAGISAALVSCHKADKETQAPVQKQIYHCPMHPNYFADKPGDCPICGMKLVPVSGGRQPQSDTAMNAAAAESGAVKIDPTTVQNIGVTTENVAVRNLKKEIRVSANIDVDETAVSIINTKIMGWIDKLFIDFTGQSVKKGQPLLTIYSPDLVSTQEEYLQAIRFYKNLPQEASPDAKKGAMDLIESSKRRLRNWDIPEREIQALEERGAPVKTMTIYSPSKGVVLEKMVFAGQNVEPGMALYRIADLSTVWAVGNVFQEDISYIKIGMEAAVDVSSLPGRTFRGKVQFVSPVLDPNTKTAAVRISIRNTPDIILKPQMFANAEILSPVALDALAVPQQAVLHTGKRDVVILALGNGYFKPQEVKLGMGADGYVQVLEGLREGQCIVTSSQFLIDSESSLREAVDRMGGMQMPMPSDRDQPPKPEKKQTPPERHHHMSMPGTPPPQSTDHPAGASTTRPEKAVYTCPMDPDVVSDTPAKCPKCGMDLVKK